MRNPELESIQVVIPKGRTLRVRNGAGFTVRVAEGTAWLTEEKRVEDTVLGAGESFRLERDGLALVFAFTEARVEIGSTCASRVPAVERGGGYREISAMICRAMIAQAACRFIDRAKVAILQLRASLAAARRFS